ncbi:hypothetical protein M4D58_26195 [Brevibacillus borstelensis]|nr:hypothetical protein [Brevibacillus borstelensis]
MDTRHFAFINMVLNDVEPLIIKDISGHGSIKSSYHYYSHVSKFVKCYTYSMAKRISRKNKSDKGEEVIFTNHSNQWDLAYNKVFNPDYEEELKQYKEVDGGRCSSKQKNFEDCRKVDNDCKKGCSFYHPTETKAQKEIKELVLENQRNLSTETLALKELVRQYDKAQNFAEDYGLRINKIKTIANQNAMMLSKYFL